MKFARHVRYILLFVAFLLASGSFNGNASAEQKPFGLGQVQSGSADSDDLNVSPDGDGGGRPDLRQGEPGSDQPSEDGTFNRLPNQPSDDDPPGCLLRERQLELIV